MKLTNIILTIIGGVGLLFILYIAFQNSSVPPLQFQALGFVFSTLFLAGFLGEQIRKK